MYRGETMKKTEELGKAPIGKLLLKYSAPAVVAMLVNAIYNVVDRMFIGQYVGEEALAGLTIIFPIMMLIFAFAGLIGAGAAAQISVRLGEKNIEGAKKIFGNALTLSITFVTGVLIFGQIYKVQLLEFFGGTADIMVYALPYLTIILAGFIFQIVGFLLNSTLRTEGQPLLSMVAMMSAAIINIILDYIFIVKFNWGVEGAAYATIIGQFIGFIILIQYYLRGKSLLLIGLSDLKLSTTIVRGIFTIGFASFISTAGVSIAMTFMNHSLGIYGGTAAIAALGVINSLYTLFIMPVMGIQQGMQPIVGYNYGAGQIKRSNMALKYSLGVSIVFSTVVFALLELNPEHFVGFFMQSNSAAMQTTVEGLKIFILMLPLLSVNLLGIAYLQSTEQGKSSMWLSLLRQFILLVPLLLILPKVFGLRGVWMATPIADAIAILITGIVLFKNMDSDKDRIEKVSYQY